MSVSEELISTGHGWPGSGELLMHCDRVSWQPVRC